MVRPVLRMTRGREGTSYTAGRDAAGRWSRLPVRVRVTDRGHWYRSDDARHPVCNDTVCRGCGHTGHFDYILDYRPCPSPAGHHDIARALGVRPVEVA